MNHICFAKAVRKQQVLNPLPSSLYFCPDSTRHTVSVFAGYVVFSSSFETSVADSLKMNINFAVRQITKVDILLWLFVRLMDMVHGELSLADQFVRLKVKFKKYVRRTIFCLTPTSF